MPEEKSELWVLNCGGRIIPMMAVFAKDWQEALEKLELDSGGIVEVAVKVVFREKVPSWYYTSGKPEVREKAWASFLAKNKTGNRRYFLLGVDYIS